MTGPVTEREKMLAGELYRGDDPALVAERLRARAALARAAALPPEDEAGWYAVLRALLGGLGEGSVVMPGLRLDYGGNTCIGARCFINYDCVLLDCARITIGDEVQVAPGVHIYTAGHPTDAATRRAGLEFALPVTVGDGAWLGGGAILCPGVSIGENAVIGAGSVVTRSIPADVVAAGNPCRVIRRIDREPIPV